MCNGGGVDVKLIKVCSQTHLTIGCIEGKCVKFLGTCDMAQWKSAIEGGRQYHLDT